MTESMINHARSSSFGTCASEFTEDGQSTQEFNSESSSSECDDNSSVTNCSQSSTYGVFTDRPTCAKYTQKQVTFREKVEVAPLFSTNSSLTSSDDPAHELLESKGISDQRIVTNLFTCTSEPVARSKFEQMTQTEAGSEGELKFLKVANVVACLEVLQKIGVHINGVTAQGIVKGELKHIMNLFFNLSKYKQRLRKNRQLPDGESTPEATETTHSGVIVLSANGHKQRQLPTELTTCGGFQSTPTTGLPKTVSKIKASDSSVCPSSKPVNLFSQLPRLASGFRHPASDSGIVTLTKSLASPSSPIAASVGTDVYLRTIGSK
ncbi:hypothetical protein PHET_01563 [Paragonimus heterotremus]|uniref:Calponin-homology (CH) domain-containing protein n=1 Tax=Paragonimus heterotremus TaxID=100268 RepID=A0A8J4T351_9TREM|nr:hypothetical protein PHET_01563 [Paragonimus heterotremus]